MKLKKSRFIGALVAAVLSVGIVTASSTVVYADTYAVNSVEDEAPSNFSCEKTSTSITLSWDAVGSADAYKVFMYNPSTKKFEKYKSTSKTSCKITGLSKGTKYYFKVAVLKKAKNGNGYNEGAHSKKISVITKSAKAPVVPSPNFTGFKSADGSKFYFNNGKLVTGWQNIDGNTYYFNKDGDMHTGWLTVKGGDKYYMDKDGVVTKDVICEIDNKSYIFDSNGKACLSYRFEINKFTIPKIGESKWNVLKSCGITNYKSNSDIGDNAYSGKVIYYGKKSDLSLYFNENNELYGWLVIVPCSYYKYTNEILPEYKNKFGNSYDYKEGMYYWLLSEYDVTAVNYNSDLGAVMIGNTNFFYKDK